LLLLLGSKDGTFQIFTREVRDLGWSGVALADLNGDGKDDIVVANSGSAEITILLSK